MVLGGDAIEALRLAVDLLERVVSPLFFLLGIYWLTVCHVAACFDRELQLARSGINGGGRGSGRRRVMAAMPAMA